MKLTPFFRIYPKQIAMGTLGHRNSIIYSSKTGNIVHGKHEEGVYIHYWYIHTLDYSTLRHYKALFVGRGHTYGIKLHENRKQIMELYSGYSPCCIYVIKTLEGNKRHINNSYPYYYHP